MGLPLQSQHTISGTFSPAKEYKWLIAYRLLPGSQAYIAETEINGGKFSLTIPENAQSGMYRLVYALTQDEFYFDAIYNGTENVILAFDAVSGVSFSTSEENKIFNDYFQDMNTLERQIISFYADRKSDVSTSEDLIEKLEATQKSYEQKSEGKIAGVFIRANTPYLPDGYESVPLRRQ